MGFIRNPIDPLGFALFTPDTTNPTNSPTKRRIRKSFQRRKLRELIFKRDGGHFINSIKYGVCHYCKSVLELDDLTLDHVIPKSQGGSDNVDNLVIACAYCNTRKGNKRSYEHKGQ